MCSPDSHKFGRIVTTLSSQWIVVSRCHFQTGWSQSRSRQWVRWLFKAASLTCRDGMNVDLCKSKTFSLPVALWKRTVPKCSVTGAMAGIVIQLLMWAYMILKILRTILKREECVDCKAVTKKPLRSPRCCLACSLFIKTWWEEGESVIIYSSHSEGRNKLRIWVVKLTQTKALILHV